MRTYEVVFLAAPTLTTEELDGFIAHVHAAVEGKKSKIVKVDNWGKRSLAYKIKKYRDAYYVVLTIEGDGVAIAELERRFRVTDYIIRFLSIRIDEDLKRSDKLRTVRQRKSSSKKAQPPAVEPGAGAETAQI